jgi:mono/diheme cytochrome c family protein
MKTSWMFIVAAYGALAGCGSLHHSEPIDGPLTIASDQAKRGQQVFAEHCHKCHIGGGAGLGPAIRPVPDFLIRFQVRQGLGAMPAFTEQRLSDEDLDALLAYLRVIRRQGG